jgi:hypothetical protein
MLCLIQSVSSVYDQRVLEGARLDALSPQHTMSYYPVSIQLIISLIPET